MGVTVQVFAWLLMRFVREFGLNGVRGPEAVTKAEEPESVDSGSFALLILFFQDI
jgi:hypothetical protein